MVEIAKELLEQSADCETPPLAFDEGQPRSSGTILWEKPDI